MDGKTLKDYILESVDHIIKRKSRPDCERICHVVTKKTKSDPKAVKEELERLVNSNTLYKIIHKGIISYRNYSSSRSLNFPHKMNATKKMESPSPKENTKGDQINGHEDNNDLKTLPIKQENESSKEGKLPPPEKKSAINSAIKPRPVGRPRKHPKISDAAIPPRKRGRPPNTVSRTNNVITSPHKYLKCDICHYFLNKKGLFQELLICTECKSKAHPACLGYSPELAIKCQRFDWQCVDCKNCVLCNDPHNDETMLFCDSCDRGFHMSCHIPKVTTKPSGSWVCHCCILEDSSCISPRLISSVHKMAFEAASVVSSSDSLPYDENLTEFERILKLYPRVVPKADNWTVEDVAKFFQLIGFPEQARAFRDQEIDGKSLLLLKRSDVLTGMDLRLGPALKIYNHIKRLQSGLPNGHLL